MKTKMELIAEMHRQRCEINQLFADAEHWNQHTRKPWEARINPDPDGRLARIRDALTQGMEREDALP